VTLEITGSRRSLSATCSAIRQNLTVGTRSADTAQRRFEFVALAVACAPKADLRLERRRNFRCDPKPTI
jgi:hypothetical protein